MTCIVGMEFEGKVFLGGDSAGSDGYEISIQAGPKVFRLGDFVMGYTSSFRMGQLLQYSFNPPEQDGDDDMAYLVSEFVPELRTCLKDGGYAVVENNREKSGFFLVGYRGKLYQIQNDFAVLRRTDGFDAVGSGASYALAVMMREVRQATAQTGKLPHPIVAMEEALQISAHFSAGVSGPFTYVHTGHMSQSSQDPNVGRWSITPIEKSR